MSAAASVEVVELSKLESFEVVVSESSLDARSALAVREAFLPFVHQVEEWAVKVDAVSDPKVARTSRLLLKRIRIEADEIREGLKAESLKRGRAIEACYKVIEGAVLPLEKKLDDIEKAAERAETARKQKLVADRVEALRPYAVNTLFLSLAEMPDEEFARTLSDAKFTHEAKAEAAARVEADRVATEKRHAEAKAEADRVAEVARVAKEKAEAEERERLRVENQRLHDEAKAREALRLVEIEKADRAKKAATEKARKEREALEEKARLERQEADRVAKVERDRLAEIARVERAAREKLEHEANAIRAAEKSRKDSEERDAAIAAAAPDREKLKHLAVTLREITLPEMATAKGRLAVRAIEALIWEVATETSRKADAL